MNSSFLNPRSIAIIGASTDEKKLGYILIKNLKESGYKGRIYPINNKSSDEHILDLKIYKSISEIHEIPDEVVISIPADGVFEELMKSYAQGVKNFIIISAGFKEIGNEEGEKLINHFLNLHPDANVLGPNCLGFIDTSVPINASFAASTPKAGTISFFSQSGALCTAIMDWSDKIGMGFSKFISLGNKNRISENDFLDKTILKDDPVFFYLESFKDGKEFIKKAKSLNNPIVVLHPGKYSETASAMQSHTGSLASNDRVVQEALDEAGIVRANGLEDIMDLMMLFNFYKEYRNIQNVAIVSNAGGPGIITTDAIKDYGLNMAKLSADTQKRLEDKLPRTANIHNPVDLVGDALADRYGYALDIVLADQNVDAVIVLLTPQAMTQISQTAEYILRLSKTHNKVVVASFMGGKRVDHAEKYLFSYGIPYFDYPERAVWALSKLKQNRSSKEQPPVSNVENKPSDVTEITSVIKSIFKAPHEENISSLNALYNFLPTQSIVLKLISDKLWHKSDEGGVFVGLDTKEKRLQAYNSLLALANKIQTEQGEISYSIVAQRMLKIDYELFLGAKRDLNFGNIVAFGLGGLYVNVIDETMLFLEYCTKDYIIEKIRNSKCGKILSGIRGQKEIDIQKIAEFILDIHYLLKLYPNLDELDINPLGVVNGEIYAVDIKVKVKEENI